MKFRFALLVAALALALLLLGLGGLVGALRSGRGICGRSAALCGLGCGLRGLGLLRLGLLCLRGHGEHLLQRSDLVLLRDHVVCRPGRPGAAAACAALSLLWEFLLHG